MRAVIQKLDDVAEALRGEYEEKNGVFVLKLEGEHPLVTEANTKLVEFRDNNRTLNGKVTDLTGQLDKFKDIDPVEHGKLKAKIAELEKAGVTSKDSVAEQILKAVKEAVEPLKEQLRIREESEKAAQALVIQKNLESSIREIGVKAEVDDRAMEDFIHRGLKIFKNVDGKVVARNGNDTPIFSKTNVTEELGMEEWAEGLRKDAPFLFKTSKGGGAPGSGPGAGPVVTKVISSDPVEFGKNLESIAKGETVVQP